MFGHDELQKLISGVPTLDINQLRLYTKYNDYSENDLTIQQFWNVLKEFNDTEQQ